MESPLVIKVKYEQTLRRFNAHILPGNEKLNLDIDMDELKAKINSLFNFPSDADLEMTYVDEDGDDVTLIDDADLFDVIRQRLKFLRIDVRLRNEKSSKASVQSSGNSTPLRSPRTENRFPNINAGVAEILKPLPKPVESLVDLTNSSQNSDPQPQIGAESSTQNIPVASPVPPIVTSPKPLKDDDIQEINADYVRLDHPLHHWHLHFFRGLHNQHPRTGHQVMPCIFKPLPKPVESLVHLTNLYQNSDPQPPIGAESSTQNVPIASPVPPIVTSPKPLKDDDIPEINAGKLTESRVNRAKFRGNKAKFMLSLVPVDLNVRPTDFKESECVINLEPSVSNITFGMEKETKDEKDKEIAPCFPGGFPGNDAGFTRMSDTEGEYLNECPYSGVTITGDYPFMSSSHGDIYPAKQSFNRCADLGTVFHRGVICDGCEVHPITGPRFKSKVKEDFDLCSMCFAKMGNEADYVRLDHPLHHRHSRSFRGLHNQRPWTGPPVMPRILKGCRAKSVRPKLESCFIMDVNVLDGTIMAPCTPFTKIWRMQNNGTMDWPKGTQLQWIGGDKFSHAISVELAISAGSIPVDKEIDIAVDFIAPELPGRYISYWRMAAPTGQKFGQRVWVFIQVDASLGRTLSASLQDLNLNLPPPSSSMVYGPKTNDMNVEISEQNSFVQANPVKPAELPKTEREMYFPVDDTLLVGQSLSLPTVPTAPVSPLTLPTVLGDKNVTEPTAPESSSVDGDKNVPPLMYPIIDVSMPAPDIFTAPTDDRMANREVEESLLKELEEMGFKQVDLNKEVLRINEYNLEQSVDDLCGVSEWDPILEELEEMGFCDKVMNKKLLVKNNGSIKHVVMDLISGEKA